MMNITRHTLQLQTCLNKGLCDELPKLIYSIDLHLECLFSQQRFVWRKLPALSKNKIPFNFPFISYKLKIKINLKYTLLTLYSIQREILQIIVETLRREEGGGGHHSFLMRAIHWRNSISDKARQKSYTSAPLVAFTFVSLYATDYPASGSPKFLLVFDVFVF